MVIVSQETQDPAYRATLLPFRWAQGKTALTFLHFVCTSCYITCRRFRCFYGESMGKYGQFYGQILVMVYNESSPKNWRVYLQISN